MGSRACENCRKFAALRCAFSGNDAARDELGGQMNWEDNCAAASRRTSSQEKEYSMRNRILAVAALTAAIAIPAAAQAQSETVGVARGSSVIINGDADGIAADQLPAFREYIVREKVPEYTVPDRVIIGTVLPEAGVTFYDVPQTFGATPYRYTVVNGQIVLVEPRSRRIVQVVQ
jgi:hypothetical protein